MGKITGFLEVERLSEAYEAPTGRLKHWREFVVHLSDEQAGKQARIGICFASARQMAQRR